MPIQVNEVIIRAIVSDEPNLRGGTADAGQSGREAIIAECVEQVLEILRERAER